MRHLSRRSLAARLVGATAAAAAGLLVLGPSAGAATSTLFTVTKLSAHRLPALTANQVITVTGTGFDEDLISSVKINGCTTDPTYVVQSATTLVLKTANDCATTSTGAITITDTSSNTYVTNPSLTGGALALTFVAAPTVLTADATHRPVVTENSQGVAYADQVTSAPTKGGTTVRVYSGSTPFVNSTTYPLAASLGGVALSGIVMHTGGDYFTGVVGAHAADTAPVLKVTSNGVSKSFAYGAGGASATAGTHDFQYKGTGITVVPASGAINGGTVISITGSGFTASTTATVGGTTCPVSGTPTATLFKCTVPAATAAGAVNVATTTGTVTSTISAGSTFTYLDR
jgi:hypothetical protein